jgi:SAM-dependent methyltransferase
MTATLPVAAPEPALETYERLAPFYDAFSADYDHETWLERLLGLAARHGLRGRRVLDVGCGTGKSAAPLAARGWDVRACDLSPGMVAAAQRRLGSRGEAFVADMRALPDGPPADLVTCLDDAVNYLLDEAGVRAAFASARRALARGGLYVFDVNSLRTYETAFCEDAEFVSGGWRFRWRGLGRARGCWRAAVDVRSAAGVVATATHVQRHWPAERIARLLADSGLAPVAIAGQTTGAVLHERADERAHTKIVFVAERRGGAA